MRACREGREHDWQAVGRLQHDENGDGNGAQVYLICIPCRSYTYVDLRWAGEPLADLAPGRDW